jgi:hypothetical protein
MKTMTTFAEFTEGRSTAMLNESLPARSVASLAILFLKVSSLNAETQRDRSATATEKRLSSQMSWLASMIALGPVGTVTK